jgi:3' terminal RNA ribose 2'-O-methyltransferase Hen1
MLLSITTTHQPATDLGYLLHKHPDRCQTFELSFGMAHVFYPEASAERCTACLLLDVDPVGIVRCRPSSAGTSWGEYVSDRPYAASSFASVAIAQVFGSALQGRCRERPELTTTPLPLSARIDVLPVRGGRKFLDAVFEPLGYDVTANSYSLDPHFPEWGDSPYLSVTIAKETTLAELLTHLYVLIPVFDNQKHYFVGEAEMENLLAKGTGWLARHPEREAIARRYLKFQPSLCRQAIARLVAEDEPVLDDLDARSTDSAEEKLEKPLSLHEQRLAAVLGAVRASGARRVVDLGCGEGKLLRELLSDRQFEAVIGMDVSIRSLEAARERLKLEHLPETQAARIQLIHGSLCYRDRRLEGFDAAVAVEVIEHLDPTRLSAFERVLFQFIRPKTVVLTTPNRDYNVKWENVGTERLRHPDHRFEWSRVEFAGWAHGAGARHGYSIRSLPVGAEDEACGAPTQMGVFTRE